MISNINVNVIPVPEIANNTFEKLTFPNSQFINSIITGTTCNNANNIAIMFNILFSLFVDCAFFKSTICSKNSWSFLYSSKCSCVLKLLYIESAKPCDDL